MGITNSTIDGDKRTVSTDALETLGEIIGPGEKRDAIHLAVEPVIAQEELLPGQDVGIDGTIKSPVGIVDPFLKTSVNPGERFWLVVYPRQITSLRHVWTHPAFPEEEEDVVASKKWLEDCAAQFDWGEEKDAKKLSYDQLMDAAKVWIETKEKLCFGWAGIDYWLPDDFWVHYEIVMKTQLDESVKINFFRCAC